MKKSNTIFTSRLATRTSTFVIPIPTKGQRMGMHLFRTESAFCRFRKIILQIQSGHGNYIDDKEYI